MSNEEVDELLAESSRLEEAGRHRDNASLMRQALVRFPDSPKVAIRAASVFAPTVPVRAQYLAQRAAHLSPDDPVVLLHAAWILADMQDFDLARDYAKKLAEMVSDEFPLMPQYFVLVGRLQMEKGNVTQAEKALTLVFERTPGIPEAGPLLAQLYLDQGRLDDALEVVTTAKKHQPEDASLLDLERRIRAASKGGSGSGE